MDYLNRVELTGKVGSVKITEVGAMRVARLSLATCYTFMNQDGEPTVETTWHDVTIFGTADGPDGFDYIQSGRAISINGRICMRRYAGADGTERVVPGIIAYNWKLLEN